MKIINPILLLSILITGCTSTSMTLKSLDQDIPATLVKKYNTSTDDYVDQGESFFLPMLLFSKEYVSKTTDGFQGYSTVNLGLVLIDKTIWSDFDSDGRINKRYGNKTILTSLVYSTSCHRKYGEDDSEHEHRTRFLLNSFGLNSAESGKKTLVLLWIPITISNEDKK